jgi:hypothetical protein
VVSCPWLGIRAVTGTDPLVRARRPVPARLREGVRPGEDRRARQRAGGTGGAGKAAGGGGKGARADSN